MSNDMTLLDLDGSATLTFECGDLPSDEGIRPSGHEPNGYFWEGLVQYLAPALVEELELDPEAGMFAAYGSRATLERLQALIAPYLDDGKLVADTVREAEASGFEFDD